MKRILSYIFIFSAMLIWSTSYLVMKNALDFVNPGFLIFLRSIITFVILFPFTIKHLKDFTKRDLILISFTGVIVSIGYLVQTIGLEYTTPGKSAFLENAYCIVVPVLSAIILKQRLKLRNILCILLCVGGVILISLDSFKGSVGVGEILSLLAGILYGVNISLTGIYAKEVHTISYTCGQFLVISLVSGLYTFIFENNTNVTYDINVILRILYLGVVVTAIAWVFKNKAQQTLPPISVSLILPFSAVIGTILSLAAKEDTLNIYLILGGIFITASIVIDSILENKKEKFPC